MAFSSSFISATGQLYPGEHPFACRECPVFSEDKVSRLRHRLETHPEHFNVPDGFCALCERPLTNYFELLDHLIADHSNEFVDILNGNMTEIQQICKTKDNFSYVKFVKHCYYEKSEPEVKRRKTEEEEEEEEEKKEVDNDADNSQYIKLLTIDRRDSRCNEIQFRVQKLTVMGKLKKAFADRNGVNVYDLRFLFDGRRINDKDTAESLEMEDNDEIEVHREI